MTRATQKEQATPTLKANLLNRDPNVLPAKIMAFISAVGAKYAGITSTVQLFQVQLDWKWRVISLPKGNLLRIRFNQSAGWLSLVLRTSAWLAPGY